MAGKNLESMFNYESTSLADDSSLPDGTNYSTRAGGTGFKKLIITGALAGYLALGSLGLISCGGGSSPPPRPPPPPVPTVSQTVSLCQQGEDEICYNATIQNVTPVQATLTITRDGTQVSTTQITNSPFSRTFDNNPIGNYSFNLSTGNVSDTKSLTMENYAPKVNQICFDSFETDIDAGSQKTFGLESCFSDGNNAHNPVPIDSATSLDGKMQTSINGFDLTLTPATGSTGAYEVGVKAGSDEVGGFAEGSIKGNIIAIPDQLAFWRRVNGNEDIYLGDFVNNQLINVRRLTTDALDDLETAWSSDGKQIAFTTNREDVSGDGMRNNSIYIMNSSDGSNQRRITPDNMDATQAYWCSNRIVFRYIVSTPKGNLAGIGVINQDGTDFTRLIEGSFSGRIPGWPNWSPDCSKLAFMTYRETNNWEINTMNANGSSQINITNNLSLDQQPKWSPDGSKIAFLSDRDTLGQAGQFNLYLINPDGTGLERLTDFPGGEFDLSWFSDSNRFTFTRETSIGTPLQIYMMKRDGTGLIQLTTEGQNRYSAVRPKPNQP